MGLPHDAALHLHLQMRLPSLLSLQPTLAEFNTFLSQYQYCQIHKSNFSPNKLLVGMPFITTSSASTLLTALTSICGANGQCSVTRRHGLTCNDPDGAGLAGPPAVSTNAMPGSLC